MLINLPWPFKHLANHLVVLKLASPRHAEYWLLVKTKSSVDADSQAY